MHMGDDFLWTWLSNPPASVPNEPLQVMSYAEPVFLERYR